MSRIQVTPERLFEASREVERTRAANGRYTRGTRSIDPLDGIDVVRDGARTVFRTI
ncbi:hypothetical protein MKX68_12620 [Paenibacillus sp. FSL M8-0212]|uniref:hypothetical protein n=1 Tax=Paenibacillus sp. FSL M8-0212 TaxID=2921618 RepID=UPI0030F7B234